MYVGKKKISEALAKKFGKRTMEIYGYKRGTMKAALEDMLERFVALGEAY
jgi:hypothetical protein